MIATANGRACARACATPAGSVHAKRREGKGPQQKAPHHTTPETPLGHRMHSSFSSVPRETGDA